VSNVPVLLEAAAGEDAALAAAARTSLARLPGKEVDADIFARLKQSSGRARQVLIELAEQRRIDGALPVFVQLAGDADPAVRSTAVVAIGAIGETPQAADLAGLLQSAVDARDREALERALMSICGRWASACTPHLKPLAQAAQPANRIVALRALGTCGGGEALAMVRAALLDGEEAVVDEAVRTLSTWPNRWPEDASVIEPLLAIARAPKKPAHQVLALRGCLQHVQGARSVPAPQRLAGIDQVLPLISRPEEKRTAISALAAIGTAGGLERLVALSADAAVVEEACSAIVTLLGKNPQGISRDQRRAALQAVVDKSKNEDTAKKAQGMLGAVK
jgi:HEAT repeat protein